ncbi:hypothetical protein MetMK1DRAFT_00026200 [Metallosphaera yellowstonensis MK1]|uniref:Uncharacterized protein n=1 Tax=Metallosphaera yellowstonensis MK1 TaxID=671065 RepID=H2C7S1_9CREN|nr:hypothetical protein MetMK1DRAFT_00026200 [Metallosphaera yellowstonensis MK1]
MVEGEVHGYYGLSQPEGTDTMPLPVLAVGELGVAPQILAQVSR